MALIKCTECGKEFSDKAPACPNCGCPTSEMLADNVDQKNEETSIEEIWDTVPKKATLPSQAKSVIQKVSAVQIDEVNRKFRVHGAVPVNGKKTGIIGGTAKGLLAVSTLGMSVAASKVLGGGKKKVGSKEWFDFDDLVSYELLEDDAIVTSGGVGQALIGGLIAGGAGLIAGGITGKRVQKKRIESLGIRITINNFLFPCILIPLITKSIKTNSKEYQIAFDEAQKILSVLEVIAHNQ